MRNVYVHQTRYGKHDEQYCRAVSGANLHVVLDSHILEQLLVRVDLVLDAFLFLLRVQVLLHFLLPEGATHDCNTSGLSGIKKNMQS